MSVLPVVFALEVLAASAPAVQPYRMTYDTDSLRRGDNGMFVVKYSLGTESVVEVMSPGGGMVDLTGCKMTAPQDTRTLDVVWLLGWRGRQLGAEQCVVEAMLADSENVRRTMSYLLSTARPYHRTEEAAEQIVVLLGDGGLDAVSFGLGWLAWETHRREARLKQAPPGLVEPEVVKRYGPALVELVKGPMPSEAARVRLVVFLVKHRQVDDLEFVRRVIRDYIDLLLPDKGTELPIGDYTAASEEERRVFSYIDSSWNAETISEVYGPLREDKNAYVRKIARGHYRRGEYLKRPDAKRRNW
jgi:hypothetical protein